MGNFLMSRERRTSAATWKTRHMGRSKAKTIEKQLPFEEMKIKELIATHQNIAGHSGSVWLHTGTSGYKNGGKHTTGRHSTCIKG